MDPRIEHMAHELHRLLDKEDELTKALKSIEENISMLQAEFVKVMKEVGMIKGQVEGVGEIKISSYMWASIPKELRDKVHNELKAIGEGGLIKVTEAVHPQTLRGFVNKLIEEGKPIPEGIQYGFNEEVKIK